MSKVNTSKEKEKIKKYKSKHLISRLFKYLKPYWLKISITVFMMIIVMLTTLVNPLLLERAIDIDIKSGNIKGLLLTGAIMLTLYIISMVLTNLRINLMAKITSKVVLEIREELYTHIQKLSFGFFDSRPVGKILARIVGDVNSLQNLFNNSITSLIPEILTIICVTGIMFYKNYKLALISMSFLPILLVSLSCIQIFSRKRWQKHRSNRSNLNGFTHEDFSGIRVVQAFGVEKKTSNQFSDYVGKLITSFTNAVRLNNLFWPLVNISWGMGTFLTFWYGVKLIQSGDPSLSVGNLIAFTMYIGMFWRPITNISNFYNVLITNFSAAERIFDILDTAPTLVSLESAIDMPEIQGHVEFDNVSFEYDKDSQVLHDVSFNIPKGSKIALVGPTGAGKTTIINLISRFYDPTNGTVLIDGIDISKVNLESLRSQMGIMLQDTFLFSDTIMENIRYGKLDATDEEIIEAAKAVNAHTFISKLKNGYNTKINERGSRLSVGQRQLISFARALLANPKILILDEATSNIDTATEKLVQMGIEKVLENRTSFVIAHRLSTIRDCDCIMVVNEGKIIEYGTHMTLMKNKGLYHNLYVSQFKFLNEGA
ncbi:ABC transporter ATP-binding protein [Oceanirhabdus sp. W0125-5]|nr:ABC transporter ATP-binding protein [Oceanirhabdus sp. W0125-5]WBW97914.1 ABC transporter ATP-binding protein [Oceanirhabdus sp. W0125-5]